MKTQTARHTTELAKFVRSYWLFNLVFRKRGDRYHLSTSSIVGFHILFPILAAVAGVVDNTLELPGVGRGVMNHYGFHVLFASAPLLVFLLARIVVMLSKIIANPLQARDGANAIEAPSLQDDLRDVATCRSDRMKVLLLMMRAVGVCAVVANAGSTRYPEIVYGQDVFDSSKHALGYLAGRVFLGYYWIYLLPLAAYLMFSAIYATWKIVSHIEDLNEYEVRCFAADGCGGFKELGQLMTMGVYLYVPLAATVVALTHTHANFYPTLQLSAVLIVLIPAQLFLPFLKLHRVLSHLKEKKLSDLERFLSKTEQVIGVTPRRKNEPSPTRHRVISAYLQLIAGDSVYRHTAAMTTWPYMRRDMLKWVTPFVPAVTSLALRRLGLI